MLLLLADVLLEILLFFVGFVELAAFVFDVRGGGPIGSASAAKFAGTNG